MIALTVRFAVVVIGYALSCLAASAFLAVLYFGAQDLAGGETREIAVASALVSVPVMAFLISYLAFVPAAVVVVLAEILAWRDWLTYALAGGGIGVAVALSRRHAGVDGNGVMADPRTLAAITAAGLLAGIVYWMTAGRSAGGWPGRDEPTLPAP